MQEFWEDSAIRAELVLTSAPQHFVLITYTFLTTKYCKFSVERPVFPIQILKGEEEITT